MNFKQLVLRNVTRNGREYATYFLSSLFSVMVFFVFSLLYFHPDLGDNLKGSSDGVSEMANFGIQVAEVVIALMSFVFLWYAFNTFLKGRKKQLSVYLTLGMSEKKLKQMVIYENILLGFTSIVTGTVVGILFSKLILLITQNILYLEEGLPFYFPLKAIAVTWLVYGLIFVLISFFTVLKLRKMSLLEMRETKEDVFIEPKKSKLYTVLGIFLILLGYSLAFAFSYGVTGYIRLPFNADLLVLLLCVLITILGTFLFFKFSSVNIFQRIKIKPMYFKNGNMLTVSNLVQRMKTNAMMYFLISIVGAIAFVGIGVAKSIGSHDFGRTQGASFAFVYNPMSLEDDKKSSDIHQKNIEEIEDTIKEAGYDYLSLDLNLVDLMVEVETGNQMTGLLSMSVLKESDFNRIMTFMKKETVKLTKKDEILKLVSTNSEMQEVKVKQLADTTYETDLVFYKDEKETREKIKIKQSDIQMSLGNFAGFGVVTDEKYQELKEKQSHVYPSTHIIHFNEWNEDKELNKEVNLFLKRELKEAEKEVTEFYKRIKKEPYDDLTEEEVKEFVAINYDSFYYSSMYETWLKTKQSNGTILLISVLLGSVFFTFSCSIIYFKLFGELEKDGKYHRSLYILGVTEKRREKMVTIEMLIMFFIPFVISTLHFVAAMSALRILIELPVYHYVFQILSVYIVFQLLFFIICRKQYLSHLKKYAENIKR
ncbi:ABC transporter permease [Vagococcus hydrophili]|uniref:ABC transporter permease n=1 Tax=Vagococcus hydrophili TaxID=2714947 RepID=A0A6G8AWM5_9ENTE|nr:ABC transporter permease [Vagococcus hydrophili]QIL49396.1 ABC transporter permease [Vagococcus hydrophili]